jgi:hypothetical protein
VIGRKKPKERKKVSQGHDRAEQAKQDQVEKAEEKAKDKEKKLEGKGKEKEKGKSKRGN